MTIKERFNELKSAYLKARSNKEKEQVLDEFASLAANNPQEFSEAYEQGVYELAEDVHLALFRQRIRPVLKIIQAKAIAERIGRSSSWFTQRLNGNLVGGTPMKFKREEMVMIEQTVREIGNELAQFKAFES